MNPVDSSIFASIMTILTIALIAVVGFLNKRMTSLYDGLSNRIELLEEKLIRNELAIEQRLGNLVTRQDHRELFEDYKRDQRDQFERIMELLKAHGVGRDISHRDP